MRLSLLFVALSACASAGAQTLPLPAGAGFEWERVGNEPDGGYDDLHFDAGGTLWDSFRVRWLDPTTGTWVEPTTRAGYAILTLGPHPPGGPARADTVLHTIGATRRSTDGGATWEDAYEGGNHVLVEVPAGYPHAGRLLVGNERGYSDDRGATWTPAQDPTGDALLGAEDLLVLPPPTLLPGSASGLDPAAPPTWPVGRVVATGNGATAFSDDGGENYLPSTWQGPGFNGHRLALVRRPDAHPLGAGPRLLMTAGNGGDPAASVWSSDDAGETWTPRAYIDEPPTGPGRGLTLGLFALSPPGTTDAGADGEAIAVLGLGHLYRTADAGDTWAVVGRAPEMSTPAEPGEPPTVSMVVGAAEMGPDGRLYVGVTALGPAEAWVWRTVEPFAVASENAAPPEPGALGVAVRPNPSAGGAVTVELTGEGAVRARVVDARGRTVAELWAGELRGGQRLELDTSGWAAGVYTVVVEAGGERTAEAFTVAR